MKLLHQKLKLLYARKLKLQPGELFKRKTAEAVSVPDYSQVHGVMDELLNTLPDYFLQLEEYYGEEGTIKLSSDKTSSPLQKHNSGLWRKVTCGLMLLVLWRSKHRSGVAANLTTEEWEARRTDCGNTVLTVAKHKTGDKQPASIVLNENMAEYMHRYYALRNRVMTRACEFFITNRCQRVVKLYDEINEIYKCKLSACTFRKMVETESMGHAPETSKNIAKSLQHSDVVADVFYRLPGTQEAIRRQQHIDMVDQTAMFEVELVPVSEDNCPSGSVIFFQNSLRLNFVLTVFLP
ncbi:unnamed protein product [Macrosiphum euphorbiae]|uniref:Uncharacterized protein n=1 Tax=Macrosiphum euphorbiae TaxID=13131 RepID=A0AAV0Y883_9HEMI|nr:unnamed protein product [Macrosiphum euphorbiae]